MMKRIALTFILAVIGPLLHAAAVQAPKSVKINQAQKMEVNFILYLPKDYNKKKDAKWPVILFLHGAGEQGDDLNRVKVHGHPSWWRKPGACRSSSCRPSAPREKCGMLMC